MPNRALSLDALRGFAILTMVLSGVIPYKVLPAWMYHAQLPPPEHQFNPQLAGFTWVDLVFPLFLFALGAAIPIALNKRIQQGEAQIKIIRHIIERSFLLAVFAIFLQHVRPHQIVNPPDTYAWLMGLVGFILLFLMFMRFPKNIPVLWVRIIQVTGWIAAIVLLTFLRYKDGTGFSLYRSDIIIIVLTNSFFFAALTWLFTRQQHMVRLAILAALLALRLSHGEAGWTSHIWDFSPAPWLYKLYYTQYLFIVIPGTIIGDYLLKWMQAKEQLHKSNRWTPVHLNTLALVSVLMIILHLIGLQTRWLWQTFIAAIFLILFLYTVLPKPGDKNELFIYQCLAWATALLIIGHCLEPFEGGIKKDQSTLSYYFISAALAIYLLLSLFIFIDVLKRSKPFKLLITNGQNPMIAYVAFANLIWPLLALSGLESLLLHITEHPWLGFMRGVLYTIAVAFLVSYFTQKRIFWRT